YNVFHESTSIDCVLDSSQIHYNRDAGALSFSFIQLTKTLLYILENQNTPDVIPGHELVVYIVKVDT
ncbi:hypothetical protein, partial [Roseburia inulinivorans]